MHFLTLPATAALTLLLASGAVLPGCGEAPTVPNVAGVYRLDPTTVDTTGASADQKEWLEMLVVMLRASELTLREDGTYEWDSFYLSDQTGRWSLEADLVTMQPDEKPEREVTAISLRVGKGTLAVLPGQEQEHPQNADLLRKQ